MALEGLKRYYVLLILLLAGSASFGQNVPFGIFYQAVARDNNGKEFANKDIDVKFSIISGNPLGPVVYEELHTKVTTSKFGVFSLIIGSGTPTGGLYDDLSKIQWSQANHFIKVEVKFDNDFIDMGTMQFLAVPYALYAQKSLEPGPPGPKGDDGDPASDNQYLSYIGDTLSISNGNKVGLANQIQDLVLDINNKLKITKNTLATAIDLSKFTQTLSYNSDNYQLSLSNGGGTTTINQIIAFRAGIAASVNLTNNTAVDLVFDQVSGVYYNDGSFYNPASGSFQVPFNGIYSFSVSINLPTNSSLIIEVGGATYETLIGPTNNSSGIFKESITMKLNKNDIVNVAVLQTNGYLIPYNFSGYFSGYRVN